MQQAEKYEKIVKHYFKHEDFIKSNQKDKIFDEMFSNAKIQKNNESKTIKGKYVISTSSNNDYDWLPKKEKTVCVFNDFDVEKRWDSVRIQP